MVQGNMQEFCDSFQGAVSDFGGSTLKVDSREGEVPTVCGLLDVQDVRVLILVHEVAANQTVPSADRHSIWKRTEGAWQGELVREAQGDYPTRLEIE